MIRIVMSLLSGAALIALFGEALAIGVLWAQGRLNPDTVHEIRELLRDPQSVSTEMQVAAAAPPPAVAYEDVLKARALGILQLEQREREQQVLKALVADSRDDVLKQGQALARLRDEFAQAQQRQQEKEQSAALEQARTILAKTDTVTALEQLMKLPLEENIALIKGMPEKKIAEFLQGFAAGDKNFVTRGQEIFQALTLGKSPPSTIPSSTPNN